MAMVYNPKKNKYFLQALEKKPTGCPTPSKEWGLPLWNLVFPNGKFPGWQERRKFCFWQKKKKQHRPTGGDSTLRKFFQWFAGENRGGTGPAEWVGGVAHTRRDGENWWVANAKMY